MIFRNRKYSDELDYKKLEFIEYNKNLLREPATINNITNMMHRLQDYENKIINKPISDATFEDILNFFGMIGSASADSLNVYKQIISDYILFNKSKGYSTQTINFMDMITPDIIDACIDRNKVDNKYVTYDEFTSLVDSIVNKQDKAIFELLYWGFKDVGYSEILDLKKSDIDFENNVVYNRLVHKELIDVLKDAINEDSILGYDLSGEEKYYPLVDSEYVIRTTEDYFKRNPSGDGQMTAGMMVRRIDNVCKNEEDTYYITADSIFRSGMFYRSLEFLNIVDEKTCRRDFVAYLENQEGISKAMAYKMFKYFYNTYLPKLHSENESNNQSNNVEE